MNHLESVLDYITENGKDTWLGDVTVACDDGTVKLNLLAAGLIFPELANIRMASLPIDLYLIVPGFKKTEIGFEVRKSCIDIKKDKNAYNNDTIFVQTKI